MRPILKRRLSGHFGRQRMFNGVAKRPKYGVDIAAPVGAIVRAPAGGIVTLSAEFYYSGDTLILGHGFDISSIFLHSCEVLIKPGDEVKQGDIIGKVGATGRVTGLHLDWRLNWFEKTYLNPEFLVEPVNEKAEQESPKGRIKGE